MKKYDLVALGNPLMDIEIKVSLEDFSQLNLVKNSMTLISAEEREVYLEKFENKIFSSGGSVANTLYDLAKASSDKFSLGLLGFIANDSIGLNYKDELTQNGVEFLLDPLNNYSEPTGTSVIFITPDGERTMRTTLGCASSLLPDKLVEDKWKNSKIIYIEGYLLVGSNIPIVEKIIERAKCNNILVAFTCSDAFCVSGELELFKEILKLSDIFFANQEEAQALLGFSRDKKVPFKDIVGGIKEFPKSFSRPPLRVITFGGKGAYLLKKDEMVHVPAQEVKVIDTTGAGDAFAAGVFCGFLKNESLAVIGERGNDWASQVISKWGGRL